MFWFSIVLALINIIFNGYVLKVLWGWFLVPAFNFPIISIPVAIGISLITNKIISHPIDIRKKSKEESLTVEIIKAIIIPAGYLLCGWIIHLFM